MRKCLTNFSRIVEFGTVQNPLNIVDLVESFLTSIYYLVTIFFSTIYLQKSASVQPRTGLSKFAKNYPKVRKKLEQT